MNKKLKRMYLFLIKIYLVCLPLNAISIGKYGSALKFIAIFPVVSTLFSGKIKIQKTLVPQLLFTLFALFSIIWSISINHSIERVISYMQFFALLLSGSMFEYTETELKKVKKALVWSSRITALIMFVFAEFYDGRLWLKNIFIEDPNYICAYFIFGIIFSLQSLTTNNTRSNKVLSSVELLMYLFLVLMTGSRGGLIAILTGITVYILTFGDKGLKHVAKRIALVFVFSLVLVAMIDYLPETLRLRFTLNNIFERGGSGRTEIWKNGLKLFARSSVLRKFFGYGTATIRHCFAMYNFSKTSVMHNMFLETLVELGVIGLIIYTNSILQFIKQTLINNDMYSFSVMLCMVVMSLSISIYTFIPYFNIMLYIIMCSNLISIRDKNDIIKQ